MSHHAPVTLVLARAFLVAGVLFVGFQADLVGQESSAPPKEGAGPEAGGTTTPSAPVVEVPVERVGEVTGTAVNVRSGPGIAYGAVTKVVRGSRVTILGERGGWYRIVMPENEYSWVAAEFLQKGATDVATVTGDAVNVRVEASTNAQVLGRLSSGSKVRVVEEREGWCRIKPVPGSVGWISVDFVRMLGAAAATAATIPADEAKKRFEELEARYKAELQKKPDIADWDLRTLAPGYRDLARGAEGRDIRFMARNRLDQIRTFLAVQESIAERRRTVARLEEKLRDLEKEYEQRIEELRRATARPNYAAVGVLKKLAIGFLPPATHKIEGENRILFLVYSKAIDLSKSEGKRVGLVGTMTVPQGWETPLIRVTAVEVLTP